MELQGTTAVVTGGASGIGRGTALELARRGADVVVADIHDERLGDTAAAIAALGRRCLPVRCDVTSDAEVAALADAAFAEFGTVDLLMNNAGSPCSDRRTGWRRRTGSGSSTSTCSVSCAAPTHSSPRWWSAEVVTW